METLPLNAESLARTIDAVRQFVHVMARHDGPSHTDCLSCARMRDQELST